MIKLIATDLDGTIIDAHGRCSQETVKAIKRAKEMGITYAICSGRPLPGVLALVEGWGLAPLADYIIGSNGGEVLEVSTGKKVQAYTLEPELIKEICDLYEPLGAVATLYGEGRTLYVDKITETGIAMAKRVVMDPVEADIRSMLKQPEIKEMMIVDPDNMENIEAFCKAHPDPRYIGFKTAKDLFEFNHPLLAKDVGVRILAAKMGICSDEIIAFGDTTNDVDMLKYVKYGIAMANGTQDAKDAAYAITDSVDEDGFAHYLNEHLINSEIR